MGHSEAVYRCLAAAQDHKGGGGVSGDRLVLGLAMLYDHVFLHRPSKPIPDGWAGSDVSARVAKRYSGE
jgi:hypothetical protein